MYCDTEFSLKQFQNCLKQFSCVKQFSLFNNSVCVTIEFDTLQLRQTIQFDTILTQFSWVKLNCAKQLCAQLANCFKLKFSLTQFIEFCQTDLCHSSNCVNPNWTQFVNCLTQIRFTQFSLTRFTLTQFSLTQYSMAQFRLTQLRLTQFNLTQLGLVWLN